MSLILHLTIVLPRIPDFMKLDLQQMLLTGWKIMVGVILMHLVKNVCCLFSSNFKLYFLFLFQVQQLDITQMKVDKKESNRKSCLCLCQRYAILSTWLLLFTIIFILKKKVTIIFLFMISYVLLTSSYWDVMIILKE